MGNRIEFINKVYIGKKAKSWKKVFSVIAVILFSIILIASILMAGGVGGVSVSVLGLLVYNLSNTGGKKEDTYISAVAVFETNPEEIVLVHSAIDYNDKLGVRDEINRIPWKDIASIYYSEELNAIYIEGKVDKEIIWKSEKRKSRPSRHKIVKQLILYLPVGRKDEFLLPLKQSGQEIKYVS